ncbi:MAG TPA: GAF domain-containing protein [Roseiflexaceae bacterium]|nr:GAF domain-containing protein [Roseiflexaceae bacterium]
MGTSQTSTDRLATAPLAAVPEASEDNSLEALHGFAQDIAGAPDLDALLRSALLASARLTGARHATALLLDDQALHIRYRVALDNGNLAPLDLVAKPMMSRGLAGWVARERVAALVADTEQDSRWLPGPGLGDLRSAIVAPLLLGSRLLGMITLGHEIPGFFSNIHLRLLEVICAPVALAVDRARFTADVGSAPDPWSAPAGARLAPSPVPSAPYARPSAQLIVALAAQLRGLTDMARDLPPEALFEDVLDTYFAQMNAILRQHGGDVDSIAGDMLLATFSHPQQGAAGAASAALEMRASAAQLTAQWRANLGVSAGSLDIGIARGDAAIGVISLIPGSSRAVGPVVGIATRLSELARGEILVAGDVAGQLGEAFAVRALRPLRLGNGTAQPIFHLSAK